MNEMNPTVEKTLASMIYGSLMVLAIGLVTSTTILALSHILMFVPALYFLPRANYKEFPKSAWALLALIIIIALSVVLNQDIAVKGIKPLFKIKYFLFGFISIAPLRWYFSNYLDDKKISCLLYALCISTTIATLSGLCGSWFGFNPVLMKAAELGGRNGGLFGMVMNYAHNMSFFLLIVAGLIVYRDQSKKFINTKFLIFVLLVNLIGFYVSYTRGAWLAFAFSFPFFFIKTNKKFFWASLVFLILSGTSAYFLAGKKVIRPQSEHERIGQWKAALYAFKERPLFGYGYLNFESHSVDIKKRYNLGSLNFASHAHNNVLEMLGSTGFLGFSSFFLWLLFSFTNYLKRDDLPAKIGLSLLVAFFVGGMTQSTISLGINLFFIMAFWVLTAVEWRKE